MYVLTMYYQHEGEEILGVFDSEEGAMKAAILDSNGKVAEDLPNLEEIFDAMNKRMIGSYYLVRDFELNKLQKR